LETPGDPVMAESQAMQGLINNLQRSDLVPEIIIPIEEFAAEKSSQSFGNTAFESYKNLEQKLLLFLLKILLLVFH